ncbi:MAG TPA: TIGR04282 family arsenosugar biosynthesis glycosyltransferase [Novimethylophilus sp.]|jgi:hypothetical protein|uniref:TIGR04282 family arsenosugar biosynthesis glycosyltransferase n=1 Tax=Novimethylophilus sp. TaxID=2137426 RepID=UPI002F40ADCF
MNVPDTALLVFARAPVAGQAKTRLIPALGPAGAAELHTRLVRLTLKNAVEAGIGPVTLWCAPDDRHPFFNECVREFGVGLQVQQGDDLGQRMAHALACGLRTSREVLLIGTDCPALGPDILRHAAQRLSENVSAVFVPAEDGGYALIGVRDGVPAVFDGIAWGSDTVMEHTRSHLRSRLLDWQELPTLADVDTPQDMQRLQQTHPDLVHGIIGLEVTS